MDIYSELWDSFKKDQSEYKDNNAIHCTICNSSNILNDNNQSVCIDCGTILENNIDYNAEWRYYGSDDSKYSDPTRCGLPTNALLPQSSIGSTISFKCNESYDMKKIRNYYGLYSQY